MSKNRLPTKFCLPEIDELLADTFWSPVDVARIGDYVLRASALKGEFYWHKHSDDEWFIMYKGKIVIETESGPIELKEGEGAVVPAGVMHKPRAEQRAMVLLLEPAALNTRGD